MKAKLKIALLCVAGLLTGLAHAQDVEQIARAKPVTLGGALSVGSQFYDVSGIMPRSASPMWGVSGNASLNFYGVLDVPVSFTVGRQGSNASYPNFQQFGLSPRYRWLTVRGGWRAMHFSNYTLSGHSFLGGGVEMTPGKFRFAAMTGRLRKARDYNSETDLQNFPAVFRRTGYAVKIGLGTERTFFDVIYFRAKDDPNSIAALTPDSTTTPGENMVFGFNSRLALTKRISFFGEGAASVFTRNLNSLPPSDSIQEAHPEVFSIFKPLASTRANYAAKAGLELAFQKFQMRVGYERIMPQFETMGTYFFANDLENWTLSPTLTLAGGRWRVFGMAGLQRNNLLDNRSETTKRFIGNGGISYFSGKAFGFDVNYMNMNIDQQNLRFTDSIRVALVTTNYGLTPRWTWSDTARVRSLVASVNYQKLNDKNPFTREFSNMDTWFATASYSHSFVASGWGVSGGLNFNRILLALLTTNRYGFTLGATNSKPDGKWQLGWSGAFNLSDVDGKPDGSVISTSANVAYSPARRHQFSLFVNVLRNNSRQFDDYTELMGGASYRVSLR